MHILELDVSLYVLRHIALLRLGVDLGDRLEQVRDLRRRSLSGRDIGHEGEDVAGLDSTEDGGHEADEEVEGAELLEGDEARAVPESEGDDEEGEALGERIKAIGPDGVAVGLAKGLLEGLAVDSQAVVLAGQRGDGTDSSRSLASQLSGVFVGLLVLLILQDDDTLRFI